MTMAEKREICTCTNCGNEAEMIVTCQLVDMEQSPGAAKRREKHTKTCTVCGSEADMIVDLEE